MALGRVSKKHLKIKGTSKYYIKTIGYCSRTNVQRKVLCSLALVRMYYTWIHGELRIVTNFIKWGGQIL